MGRFSTFAGTRAVLSKFLFLEKGFNSVFIFLYFSGHCQNPSAIKPLSTIYFSLGSNQGDPFVSLQRAVNELFFKIGPIIKISSVYKSPAMGFEGDDFLNCVVCMQTRLSPKKVLKKILKIESEMGRKRSVEKGYRSRIIDIDILFFGDLAMKAETLRIPHPEIQNRKFVLLPLAELDPHFVHPVFNQNVIKLLAATPDKSNIEKLSKWLRDPQKEFDFSGHDFIAIEGNIGSGKTSLATLLSSDFNAKLVLEQFSENPFLPKFYHNPSRYAFPLEMSFMAGRYQQLFDNLVQGDLFQKKVIADFDAHKSMIFGKLTLPGEEFEIFKKLFHLMHKELPKPDLYIFLHQNPNRLLSQIKQRGREYEMEITTEYLEKIQAGYLQHIKALPTEKVRTIDISELDFLKKRKDYLKLLKLISGKN